MQGSCRGNPEASRGKGSRLWGTLSIKRAPERLQGYGDRRGSGIPPPGVSTLVPLIKAPSPKAGHCRRALPLAMSLQRPLLRRLNLVLNVKEKCLKQSQRSFRQRI